MSKVSVFDMTGNQVSDMEISDTVFGIEPNEAVMHAMVVNYLANQRQGTQSTLTRTEVSGGGRKPWRQKGTGHARQGSTRSPQWTGGGVVFAPKPRDYSVKMNKREKQIALFSALSSKVQDSKLIVVDELALEEVKTAKFAEILKNLKADKALVVTKDKNENVILSSRNIPNVDTIMSSTINVYDILKHDSLVITKDAALAIEEVYA